MVSCKGLLIKSSSVLVALAIAACAALFFSSAPAYAAVDGEATGGLAVGTADTVKVNSKYGDDSVNTYGQANIRTVYRFGWVEGGNNNYGENTVTNLDVTGDGWADKIKVEGYRTSRTSGYLRGIKVWVNGDRVFSYSNYNNYINRAVVSVITLKNKRPFLWVDVLDGKGNAVQRLYLYDSGDFTKVVSNKDVAKKKTSNQEITNIYPSGNTINVTYNLTTTATGNTKLRYTYEWEDGWLNRTSDTTRKLSFVTRGNGAYTTDKLTAAGSFKVYKNTSLKKVKFTVKAGKKVQILSACLSGKKLLFKVSYNGKTGWISCPKIKRANSKSPYTLFYETYGKVKLNTSVPEYSSTKEYKASELQLYNDHALYVARNEICARNGYRFTNGELTNRFKNKSWYSTRRTALNRVEQHNLDLIASIERNRGSLYAA